MTLYTFLILVENPWGGRNIFARAFPQDTSTQDALDSTILAYQTRPTYHTGDYILAYRWDIGIVCASKEENSMTIHGGTNGTIYTGFRTSDMLKSPIPL